jgi:hypothetical protein
MIATTYKRIPIGAKVRHSAAPEGTEHVGTVVRRLKPCVGAPYMVRVEWRPGHSAPYNEHALVRVDV